MTHLTDDPDDKRVNPSSAPALEQVLSERVDQQRRQWLKAGLGGLMLSGASLSLAGCGLGNTSTGEAPKASTLKFRALDHSLGRDLVLAPNYEAQVLLAWGDSIKEGVPDLTPGVLDLASAPFQAGYNCDYTAYLPLSGHSSRRGLLVVNHEYTLSNLMYPGSPFPDELTPQQLQADMLAHGLSIVEIRRRGHGWELVKGSDFNRRITPLTDMVLDGPAAAHPRMQLSWASPGTTKGTWNNCAGGVTPWGTILTAEENTHLYYEGDPSLTSEGEHLRRFGTTGKPWFNWHRIDSRFRLNRDPNFALHGSWMVEIDPAEPNSTPVKHTALGRFKHEGASVVLNRDNQVVLYMGDDQTFEYLYRFVCAGRFDATPSAGFGGGDSQAGQANRRLLSDGVLSVARFNTDGSLDWLPLVFGQGPLTPANGLHSQADVVIDARRAADLLGATPLDRPEDVAVHHRGKVFVALTNNSQRSEDQIDAANPRPNNDWGHILELTPPGGDHTASRYDWGIFLLCGNPFRDGGLYASGNEPSGWFANPDNLTFDPQGRLWIATDGAEDTLGIGDGLWACDIDGAGRRLTRHFARMPLGAEATGPSFTPNGKTMFLSVQHPGQSLTKGWDDPNTRWPDFQIGRPPRPAVVAIRKKDGGEIGS